MLIINGSSVPTFVSMSSDATISSTGVLTLANSGVVSGTYGSSTIIPIFQVDSKGRILVASSVAGNFQTSSSNLSALAALSFTDGNIIVGNGTTWVVESGATARTSLGLGTTDSPNFAGLSLSGTAITSTATELNLLDGVNLTLTAAEFNLLDGRTGTLVDSNNVGSYALTPSNASSYAITSITAGTGLSGGTITTSGTIAVDFGTTHTTAAYGDHTHSNY